MKNLIKNTLKLAFLTPIAACLLMIVLVQISLFDVPEGDEDEHFGI